MKETTVNQRIKILIDELDKGNKLAFSKRVGVSNQGLGDIVGEKQTNPSYPSLYKIAKALPQVRIEWLVLGEGEMLKTPTLSAGVPKSLPYMAGGLGYDEAGELITPPGAGSEGISSQLQAGETTQHNGRPMPSYSTPFDIALKKGGKVIGKATVHSGAEQEPAGLDLVRQVAQHSRDIKELQQLVRKLTGQEVK